MRYRSLTNSGPTASIQSEKDNLPGDKHLRSSYVLERALGNHVAANSLGISHPTDHSEKEADRVANKVMNGENVLLSHHDSTTIGPQTSIQRKISTASNTDVCANVPSPVKNGKPLSKGEKHFFESRFQYNFGQVKIFNDKSAHRLAGNLNAKAFTYGNNIVFGEGHYAPSTAGGKKLLAHELTHVIQQQNQTQKTIQRQEETAPATTTLPPLGPLTSPSLAEFLGFRIVDNFTFGQSQLTGEQQTQLQQYASTVMGLLRDHPSGTIEITGHTDAPGEVDNNMQLGDDRAEVVKAFLVGQGVDASRIATSSRGEGQLRVPTRDRDRRNRRVEIRFHVFSGFNLGVDLTLGSIPSPDRDTSPAPTIPFPHQIPYDVLVPQGPLIPYRRSVDIMGLPPVTTPPSRDFLREMSTWLTGELGREDIARLGGRMAEGLGMDRGEITDQLNDALISAGEAGLKELLQRIIYSVAGSPSPPPSQYYGPLRETGVPGERIFTLPPIPF